jgi:hypothetical protein
VVGFMTAPRGLGAAGKRVWSLIQGDLPEDWELDEREIAILELAARQADDVATLERAVKRDGLTVEGSAGQPRLNPAVVELRQGRLAVGRLLGQIALPDADKEARSETSKRAQHAAQVRWRQRDTKRRRNGAA